MLPDLWYIHQGLDRATDRRTDADWLAERLADPASRVVPIWHDKVLITGPRPTPQPVFATATESWWRQDGAAPILLGMVDGIAHFAADVGHIADPKTDATAAGLGHFVDLRRMGWLLPAGAAALLAQARAMIWFHQRSRYCGVCGAPTVAVEAGTSRRCSNAACAVQVFPRLDPAVIVLVTHGDRILLGRQRVWPHGMHSVLAGFVEPGESLESCIHREVREEAGVELDAIRYQASQPWPFPQSLMLGYRATARTTRIECGDDELEHAGWYDRPFLQAIRDLPPGDGDFWLPTPHSIARWLIDRWLDDG